MTNRLIGFTAAAALAVGLAGSAAAQQKTLLAVFEDVPPTLNYDGPNSSSPATQMGIVQLMEPMVYYKLKETRADGAKIYDFNNFEGRLAESWTYDAATRVWTFKLRRNVKGCGDTTFNADDVIYTFARAKSSSGNAAVGTFLANVASVDNFPIGLGGVDRAFRDIERNAIPADLVETPGVTAVQVARLFSQGIKTRAELAGATPDKVVAALALGGATASETAQKMIDAAKTTTREPKKNLSALGDEVKKIDDYTVQIRQAAPNRLLLPVLTIFALLVFDKETMEKNATADDPWSHQFANNTNAAGFGPYCLDRWEKDREVVFTANPNYFRGKADIERVVIRKQPQSAQRMAVLRTGQAQLTEALTPKEFDSLRNVRGVKVTSVPSNASTGIWMNWSVKPWNNVDMRKALAYAVPYERILKDVYFGDSIKMNGMFTSFFPGYSPPPEGYTTNIAKAKEHLAKAGFPDGKGLAEHKDSFLLSYPVERENVIGPAAIILQSALSDIGIPIKLNPMPMAQFTDRQLVKKDLEFFLVDFSKSIGIDGVYATQLLYVTGAKGGISNYTRYSNPEVDDLLLNKAKIELDENARNAALAQIQRILWDQVAIVPVSENNLLWAHSEKLTGLGFHAEQSLRFYDLKLEN
ncbi:MAG: ABC transporter substrate-binding protein [Alphaproteobacteria bacterium]|nr:ABC transporter substrate-binding protein [Alphaproteobacteria bacterium]